MSEPLYALCVALVLLAAMRAIDTPSLRRTALVGLGIGVGALVRSEAIALVVIVGAVLAVGLSGRRVAHLAVLGAVALAAVAPWCIRNSVELHRPMLVSSEDGSVIAGANCALTYRLRPGLLARRLPPARARPQPGYASARLRGVGLRYARDHAARLPAVEGVRLLRTFGFWQPTRHVYFAEGRGMPRARGSGRHAGSSSRSPSRAPRFWRGPIGGSWCSCSHRRRWRWPRRSWRSATRAFATRRTCRSRSGGRGRGTRHTARVRSIFGVGPAALVLLPAIHLHHHHFHGLAGGYVGLSRRAGELDRLPRPRGGSARHRGDHRGARPPRPPRGDPRGVGWCDGRRPRRLGDRVEGRPLARHHTGPFRRSWLRTVAQTDRFSRALRRPRRLLHPVVDGGDRRGALAPLHPGQRPLCPPVGGRLRRRRVLRRTARGRADRRPRPCRLADRPRNPRRRNRRGRAPQAQAQASPAARAGIRLRAVAQDLTRRSFLAAGGTLGLLALAPPARVRSLLATAQAAGGHGRFLTAHELGTLRAVTARFVPGPPEDPGSRREGGRGRRGHRPPARRVRRSTLPDPRRRSVLGPRASAQRLRRTSSGSTPTPRSAGGSGSRARAGCAGGSSRGRSRASRRSTGGAGPPRRALALQVIRRGLRDRSVRRRTRSCPTSPTTGRRARRDGPRQHARGDVRRSRVRREPQPRGLELDPLGG